MHANGIRLDLANIFIRTGEKERALDLISESLSAIEDRYGANHPVTIGLRTRLAETYLEYNQFDKMIDAMNVNIAIDDTANSKYAYANMLFSIADKLNYDNSQDEVIEYYCQSLKMYNSIDTKEVESKLPKDVIRLTREEIVNRLNDFGSLCG